MSLCCRPRRLETRARKLLPILPPPRRVSGFETATMGITAGRPGGEPRVHEERHAAVDWLVLGHRYTLSERIAIGEYGRGLDCA